MGGHTMTEKILARGSGRDEVFPGEVVTVGVDALFMHSPSYKFRHFEKIGGVKQVFNSDKVVICAGQHLFSPSNNGYANAFKYVRAMAKRYKINNYYDFGSGLGHYLMVENGHVWPGAIAVGSDSHTTAYGCLGAIASPMNFETTEVMLSGKAWFKVPPTIQVRLSGVPQRGVTARDVANYTLKVVGPTGALWKAIEFTGSYIKSLSIWQRMFFCILTTEMGGTCGIIEPDEKVLEFMNGRSREPFTPVYNDPDAEFCQVIELDISKLEPQVALPPQPENCVDVGEALGLEIRQAYVGGCTGGGIEDMRMAAEILRGRRVHPEVRMLIVPGTPTVLDQMAKEGLVEIFNNAGAGITPPYCGPCQMICVGNLADQEAMIGTHPRNQAGRAGNGTKNYLANPYTTAASAVAGRVADPRDYL